MKAIQTALQDEAQPYRPCFSDQRGHFAKRVQCLLLCRSELKAALQADRAFIQLAEFPPGPPNIRSLALLAAAAGLPYVGFGFVDNAIMVRAD